MINGTYFITASLSLVSNQNHKTAFKFILFEIFNEEILLNFFGELLIRTLIPKYLSPKRTIL